MAPTLTIKTWTGVPGECFTHEDMNRVCSNVNTLSAYLGIPVQSFATATRESQFDYTEAQKLEDRIAYLADLLGVSVQTEGAWAPMRSVSYVDFQRWESGTKAILDACDDGRHTLQFYTAEDVPRMPSSIWSWSFAGGSVSRSGTGWSLPMAFRVAPGSYTFSVSAYGLSSSQTVTVGSSDVSVLCTCVSVVTVRSRLFVSSMSIGGAQVPDPTGTAVPVALPLGSHEVRLDATVGNDSPSYGGVASGIMWSYSAYCEAVPSAASVEAQMTLAKVGNTVTVTESGEFTVPVACTLRVMAIAGGGGRSGSSGGNGGEWREMDLSADGAYTAEIGLGAAEDGTPGDTVLAKGSTEVFRLQGGKGAGGGGGCKITSSGPQRGSSGRDGGYRTGGGGAGYRDYGGSGGTGGGSGGDYGSDGEDGTVIEGMGYGGSSQGSGGGGGGYGANGGAGSQYAGGGGGGAYGGTGGMGAANMSNAVSYGGYGYGAGGGGKTVPYLPPYTTTGYSGGGGGGGLGPTYIERPVGEGAPGCMMLRYSHE